MNYPSINEYKEAILFAEDKLYQLNNLRPVLEDDGTPVMSSGNFAVVFKMKDEETGKLHALKCFTREQEGRAEAYRQIAEELEYVSSTFLTPIKYLDKEFIVDSDDTTETEFPVLLMDWVEGETLDKYIRKHLDDQYELSLLAYQFSRLAMWLMPQPFAHGDLKPDNILVKDDGTLVLVDYDGMYVPAMKGQSARELGSPDFRHPSRTEADFDEHIDDFSLASILLSLKTISLQPSLLEEYGASDRLLFSANDYRNLSGSKVMDALKSLMQDTELASLYSLFILAISQNNLSQVSFRLFNLSRPERSQYEKENLSTEVTDDDLANAWTDEYGVMYSLDRKRLLKAPKEIKEYTINKSTIVVCESAFASCTNLRIESIPNKVQIIGRCAFWCCYSLFSLSFPKSIRFINREAFYCCKHLTSIVLSSNIEDIGKGAFAKCISLKSISLPYCIKEIEKYVFSGCTSLSSVVIPNSVVGIGDSAFQDCIGLEEVIMSDNVSRIGKEAFRGCERLRSLFIPKSVDYIGDAAFMGCILLESIIVDRQNSYYNSRNNCNAIIQSDNNRLLLGCSSTIIPDGIMEIGGYSFWRCRKLSSIEIPNTVQTIGSAAFEECSNLVQINIPNSIETIGAYAFKGCGLKSATIPAGVKVIGAQAFSNCIQLSSITILSKSFTIQYYHFFNGCDNLSHIFIPIGYKNRFEEWWPDYKDKLVEQINGWIVKDSRLFDPEEIAAVKRAEVVASQYGNSVCFFMNTGGQTYIPLSQNSSLTVGDTLDLKTAKLITLCREGDDDIYRVME